MLQLLQRLAFNLAHSLTSYLEDATDFLKRVGVSIANAVAQFQNFALAIRERLQHIIDALTKQLVAGGFGRT